MRLEDTYAGVAVHKNRKGREELYTITVSDKERKFSKHDRDYDSIFEEVHKATLLKDEGHKLFYISQKVQKHAELIKFEKIKLEWFQNIKEHTGTYIIDREQFFRYSIITIQRDGKSEKIVHALYVKTNLRDRSNDTVFDFGIFDDCFKLFNYRKEKENLCKELMIFFSQIMCFVELSDIELITVPHKERIKSPGSFEKKFDNRTGTEVIFVDTSWNKIIVTEGFPVTGHFRIQPYGMERTMHKIIWIEPYMKQGYKHKGGKTKKK